MSYIYWILILDLENLSEICSIILPVITQQTAPANGPQPPMRPATPPPSTLHPHLHQRQVRVQVGEAVQDHRAAVLDHLQPHTVPNVPHPPRGVKHLEQLPRLDAARLGLHPREIDHGCPRSHALSHSSGILTRFICAVQPKRPSCCPGLNLLR